MMATVVIPGPWLTATGGEQRLSLAAATVGELRDALLLRFPALRPWLDNGLGGLPEFLHVFVGDEDIRIRQDLATPLLPADEVRFIPIMSGGATGRRLKTGVGMFGDLPLRRLAEISQEVEQLGYDDLWFADERFYRECYVALTHIAHHTKHIGLGTAVTNPYTRHPALTAQAAASVDELSGQRLKLGIGAGGSNHGPLGIKREKPLTALREMTELMRRLWRGERVSMDGKVLHLRDGALDFAPVRPDIPVYIAARGPETLKLAGEIGDGAIIGAFTAESGIRYALGQIRAGATQAGRSASAVETVAWVYTCIDEDPAVAQAMVAKLVVNTLQNSRDILERIEVQLPPELLALFERTGWSQAPEVVAEAARLLPPSILDQFSLTGNVAQVAQKLEAILSTGVDEVAILPFAAPGSEKMDVIRRFRTQVLPLVAG